MKTCPTCGAKHIDESDACDCGYRFGEREGAESTGEARQSDDDLGLLPVGLILAGILIALYAIFGFETSVSASYAERVENVGLLQRQLIYFQAGGVLVISGVALFATDKVLIALRRLRK